MALRQTRQSPDSGLCYFWLLLSRRMSDAYNRPRTVIRVNDRKKSRSNGFSLTAILINNAMSLTYPVRALAIILPLAVLLPPAQASADAQEWTEEMLNSEVCQKGQNALNHCAYQLWKSADTKMNNAYNEKMHYLTSAGSRRQLKIAQEAWLTFRDNDCSYVGGEVSGIGSNTPLTTYLCQYRRTISRLGDLDEYLSCRDNGCPY